MQIDVVSDTVCPWCYIGKRRLERAIAMRPDLAFDVRWRPYRLDPNVPKEGVDRRAYLKAKFGDNPRNRSAGEIIRTEGASEGIAFAFDKITRTPNTLDSHRLVRWAASAGVEGPVVESLFAAYFLEGRDVGDRRVLTDVAGTAGMDVELVSQLLEEEADSDLIEKEDALAHELGITGVPTYVFDNRFMISGAREPDVLLRLIDKATQLSA